MFVQGYMEFVISSMLAILAPKESVDSIEYIFYIACVFLVIAIILLPALYIWILL